MKPPPPKVPVPHVLTGSGHLDGPVIKGGQGREAPDIDVLFTIVISMLFGVFIGALCGSLFTWLILGGGQ